jgi:hypothetical protein
MRPRTFNVSNASTPALVAVRAGVFKRFASARLSGSSDSEEYRRQLEELDAELRHRHITVESPLCPKK